MATLPDGFNGKARGRIRNLVYYTNKWGTLVVRTIGIKNGSKGEEFANQDATALITKVLKPVQPIIKVGFQHPPAGKHWHYYNYASSYNKKNAIKGRYPNQEIDFEKLKFSIGDMPAPLNAQVVLNKNKLEFTWDADLESEGTLSRDQVMLVAYFPETMTASILLSGARRSEEKEVMTLPRFRKRRVIEVYIAFISDDRETVSDSVHIGQLVWDK
ncbi:DUF6266 family protein [Pedobacter sp. AW31-3R]|uniref:DUF6266 family protein n=1 Tax=Pedobacter sp. AW31-3R TaxID=3445781 RepID=UPI003F9FB011